MTEGYRSEQGTIVPTIFWGFGGVGGRIVDRIAMRAAGLPNWESQIRPLTAFVSTDTNKLDQNKLTHIPLGNRMTIGAFEKPVVIEGYRRSQNQQALHWLDPNYQPRKGRTPGAGQIRIESRLGFFHQSPSVRKRLREIVDMILTSGITWRQTGDFYVYLFGSLAGGTASGSFLSAAYLIEDVVRNAGDWQPRIIANLLLSTLLTDVVGKDLHRDIHANTYAALKELEHLTKLNYKQVRDEGRKSEKFAYWHDESTESVPAVDHAPFFLTFLFDRPANFSLASAEPAIADAAFLQVFTPNVDNMASALDNYQKHLESLTHFPGELQHVGLGYTKNFGAMGAAAMVLPGKDLLEYCTLLFAAEAVRSQITFGLDESVPSDDRARALAKLAVNYADPKFQRLSDADKDHAINQAFLESVREMARQDEREDLKGGFWYHLVESVEEGPLAGITEKGEVQHSESTSAMVRRLLEENRRALLDKVSIKERAFSFHAEGANQYLELVSRLEEDVRAARVLVQQGLEGLKRSARDGEVVAERKLDPITERYLVLRLLEECERKWIPEAQKQFDAARAKDIGNPAVRDRLRDELYRSLQQAAADRGRIPFRPNFQPFFSAREEAQEYYRGVAAAARKLFDAEIGLGQLRELLEYLRERARQYAALARHMNTLVHDLNLRAEELRNGQWGEARLSLSVEVFETLDEPRRRLWHEVHQILFVDGGRYLSTFDRAALAECITNELKPRVREDGAVIQKSTAEAVADIREALLQLGRQRLRPSILGDTGDPGLDLHRGLVMEARIALRGSQQDDQPLAQRAIEGYIEKKTRALAQISGVLARVNSGEWRALNDGTLVDRTRHLVHGFGADADQSDFVQRLKTVLEQDGRQVNLGHWHDPRLVIVYDVELPIPLYYVRPVIDEVEKAYLLVQADEKRSYNLHTDYHWEESLPNLNPRAAELQVGWAVRKIAEGLVSKLVWQDAQNGSWFLQSSVAAAPDPLGPSLSAALYKLGEYHRNEDLHKVIERDMERALGQIDDAECKQRQQKWRDSIELALAQIALRQSAGQITQEDVLDRSVLRVLVSVLGQEFKATGVTAAQQGYRLNG